MRFTKAVFTFLLFFSLSFFITGSCSAVNLLHQITGGEEAAPQVNQPSADYPPAIRVDSKYTLEGIASWYTMGNGTRTANGEIYDAHGDWSCGWTAAHKKLPYNTIVRVKKSNGTWVVVRINDRGPFVAGRVIDITKRANKKLKMDGIARVKLEVIKMGDGKQFHHYSTARAKEVVKGWNDIMNAYNSIGNTSILAQNDGEQPAPQNNDSRPSLETYSPEIRPKSTTSASERAYDICKILHNIETGASLSQDSAEKLQQAIKDLGFNPGPVDGKVGPRTLAGAKKLRTFLAQCYLKRLGHDPGPLDGLMGPKTRAGIQKYYAATSQSGGTDIDLQLIQKLRAADATSSAVTD